MLETHEAVYLGGKLPKNASREVELNNRISKALQTCYKLKFFWKRTRKPYPETYQSKFSGWFQRFADLEVRFFIPGYAGAFLAPARI